MSKVYEYRVRPVIRYVVTRYHSFEDPEGSGAFSGGSESIGIFDSEYAAEAAKQAFEAKYPEYPAEVTIPDTY